MKQDNVLVQLGMIGFSLLLSVATVFFSFQLVSEYGQADLLQRNIPVVDEITAPLTYETRLAKGDQLFNATYYSLAATEYSFAINIQPSNPAAYGKLGQTHLKLGENEKALDAFERAVENSKNNSYTVEYAIALIRTKDFDLANSTLAILENNQEALFYRVLLEAYNENHDEAQRLLKAAMETPGRVSLASLNQIQAAYDDYNNQIEGQDTYLNALLSQAMIDAGEFQLAEEYALGILNEKNDYRDVWILLGYAQLKTEQYQDAEDSFKEAKTLDPIKSETHYFLGTSHYLQGEYAEAVAEFELALLHGFEPEEEVYRQLAESHLFLDEHEEALAAYEFLIKLDPNSIEGFIQAIQISVGSLQDLDRALTLAQDGVTQFPNDAISHNLLASVYLERGEWDAAEAAIKTALSLDTKRAETHFNLGLLEEARENLEAASNAYKAAHELAETGSPTSIEAAEKFNSLILNPNKE